ncbi:MAG: hypothetical protein R2862_13500 [Thermoanaerobaculia bacterium]
MSDPTDPIRRQAATFAGVDQGTACNQSSFKAEKGAFLFIGPGAKGVGYKAMFKLDASLPQARKLAGERPDRFEAGTTGWVTARFTAEDPLPKAIWSKWLRESYEVMGGGGGASKRAVEPASKKVTKKKTAKKSAKKAAKMPATKKRSSRQR